ncbi:MAG: tetratricopeptide repeat protein [Gammaproteobacteria bacterium]|nr:tetratricopeptide repeat protein [Gammaproteobacteria bacterium]
MASLNHLFFLVVVLIAPLFWVVAAASVQTPMDRSVGLQGGSYYKLHKNMRPLSPRQQAELSYHEALLSVTKHEMPLALNALRQTLSLYPLHHDARKLLIALLIKQDHLSQAEVLIEIGLTLKPINVELYKLKSQLLMQRKSYHDAVAVLEHAIEVDKVDASFYVLLAAGYREIGLHQNAAEIYRQLLRKNPDNVLWWLGLALSLDAVNANNDALDAYANVANRNGLEERIMLFVDQRIITLKQGRDLL